MRKPVLATLVAACMILVSATASQAVGERRLALVVGNSGYSAWPHLKNAVNDAKLIAEKLKPLNFEVTAINNVDRVKTLESLRLLNGKAGRSKVEAVLFYFAGHGVQISGDNYLIPVNLGSLAAGDIALGALSLRSVMEYVKENIAADAYIFIIDACREVVATKDGRSAGGYRGLGGIVAPPSFYIAYSTAPDKVALDGRGSHSPFARAFADALSEEGLTIEETFRVVRRAVYAETKSQQTPWDESALFAPFYFRGTKTETGSLKAGRAPWRDDSKDIPSQELMIELRALREEIKKLKDRRWQDELKALREKGLESEPVDRSLEETDRRLREAQKAVQHREAILAIKKRETDLAQQAGGTATGSIGSDQLLAAAKTGNDTGAGFDVTPSCPRFQVWSREGYVTIYEQGRTGDGLAVMHRGEITKTARECQIEAGRVRVKVGFSGRVLLGPKGTAGNVSLPLTVFVNDAKQKKVVTDKVKVDVAITQDKPIGYFSVVRTMVFNIPEGSRPSEYEVFVAFDNAGR